MVITPLLIGINHFIVQSVNNYVIVLGEPISLIHIPSGKPHECIGGGIEIVVQPRLLVIKKNNNNTPKPTKKKNPRQQNQTLWFCHL